MGHLRLVFVVAITTLIFAICLSWVHGLLYCGRGERYVPRTPRNGGQESCLPCSHGFNDRPHHRQKRCHQCTVFNEHDPTMTPLANCTRFHDTSIGCVENFYFERGRVRINNKCRACTNCTQNHMFLGQDCSTYSDAICCKEEGMIIRNGRCEPLLYCGIGEYLQPRGIGKEDTCKPCPSGWTIKNARHRLQQCKEEKNSAKGQSTNVYLVVLSLILSCLLYSLGL